MEGRYFYKVNESRNQLKLKRKLEELGHTNVEVWYEPVRRGPEMGGPEGGVFFSSEEEPIAPLGYNYDEAYKFAESFYDLTENE